MPDYYNTFFRNYDQALGRFVSLDPMAEAAESLTGYNYSGNNPVMFNDPLGDVYGEQAGSSWKHPGVDANGIPEGDPGYGGGGGGSSRGDAFIRRTAETFFNNAALRRDAALGDPNALSRYVAKYGEPSILDFTGYVDWYKDENGKPYTVDGISGVGEWYILNPLKTPAAEQERGIGQPGAWESIAPVWGSGRSAIDHFQNGNYWRGAAYTALAISDVFLVKAAVTALGKAAVVGVGKLTAREAAVTYSDDAIKAAQKLYPKKAGITELHHIEPKYLGGASNGALVPLDAAYHQVITNTFREIYPYGLGPVNQTKMLEIMKEVYSRYPLPPGFSF